MTSNLNDIDELLNKHYNETSDGLVDASPSRLTTGQGTEKNFYILKIDLVGSTMMLAGSRKTTYLRLAHTFLSTVDKITQERGADSEQTEYAGDSVLAYFPENISAENVLVAACLCRMAVIRIAELHGAIGALKPRCKVVLHYAPLIVAKIGPRAGSFISAIGHPIHRVAYIEKQIGADTGRTTEEFYKQLALVNRKFLTEVNVTRQEEIPSYQLPRVYPNSSLGLANILKGNTVSAMPSPPQYKTINTLVGYDIKWGFLNRLLNLI